MAKIAVVDQIGADIYQPLDINKPPNLEYKPVTPQYGLATLHYAVDSYRKLGSNMTISLFWTLPIWTILVLVNSIYINYKLDGWGIIEFIKFDIMGSIHCLLFFMASWASLLLVCKILAYSFNEKAEELQKTGGKELFNDESITEFIMVDEKTKIQEKYLKNSQNVIYRNLPIATITYKELVKNETYLVTNISGRDVYIRGGIFEDLLVWAVKDIPNNAELLVKCCSFDKPLIKALNNLELKFEKINVEKMPGIPGGFLFGKSKDTYRYEKK